MKQISVNFLLLMLLVFPVFAQKGVDNQTQKVTENKTVRSGNEVTRTFDFGREKGKNAEILANPYKLTSKRDVLVETIVDVLETQKFLIDDAASRLKDGLVVTQPHIFAKGSVITKNELNRYAILTDTDSIWTRGRYTLTIEIQSIDGNQNNVSVTAKVEGKTEGVLGSEWATLPSSGEAENRFLTALVEAVTGTSPGDSENP